MQKQKATLWLAVSAVLCALFWTQNITEILWIPTAHAQPAGDVTSTITSGILTTVYFIIAILNLVMWVLFYLLDIFLDPQFIFGLTAAGEDGPLLNMLHEIWILSRDLINVLFVFVLIAGALVTIVQAKSEKVKEYLPRFLLAIVIVNFSWFIPRVIFDVSQVLTATVFEIPMLLGSTECKTKDLSGATVNCRIMTNILFFEETDRVVGGGDFTGDGVLSDDATSTGWYCPLKPFVCVQFVEWGSTAATSLTNGKRIINGLIVNHAHLGTLATIMSMEDVFGGPPGSIGEGATELLMAILRAMLVLIIHIGLLFPIAAMAVAFFLRIPILWITIAFMPFAAVGYLLKGGVGGFDPWEKIWKRFLTAVFLPVVVAIPLTVGFIMVNAGYSIIPTDPAGIAAAGVKFPVIAGVDSLYQFMWLAMALFVMYTGVFAAMKQDEMISGAVSGIKSMGDTLGKFALKAPLAAPIIPGPGGGPSTSILAGLKTPQRLLADIEADGILGGAGVQGQVGTMEQVIREQKNDFKTTIDNHFTAAAAGDAATVKREIDAAIEKLKTKDSTFALASKDAVIDAMARAAGKTGDAEAVKRKYSEAAAAPAAAP